MKIRIFQNQYTDPNPHRNQELQSCFQSNQDFVNKWKLLKDIEYYPVPERLTYNSFFDFANRRNIPKCGGVDNHGNEFWSFPLGHAKNEVNDIISVFANSDIYFDETIFQLNTINWEKHPKLCLALSRWDINEQGHGVLFDTPDSQDVWIFKGYIPHIPGADFFLGGVAGCDNKIAYLLEENGYDVRNPSRDIRCYHLHLSGVRNYVNFRGEVTFRLEPPYKLVPTCDLSELL